MTHRVTGEWIGLKRQQAYPSIDFLDPRSFSVDWDSCILVRCLPEAAAPGDRVLEFEFVGRSFRRDAPLCAAGERLEAVPPGSLLSLSIPAVTTVFERRSAIIYNGVHPRGRANTVAFRAIAVPFGDSTGDLRYALGVVSHTVSAERVRPQPAAEFLEYRDGGWLRIDAASHAAVASA